jgi:hypothetical protein
MATALRAQTGGLGGCGTEMSVDTTVFEGFGDVSFFLGSCVAEHGDTLIVVAATDEDGVTYVLDSPSSFQF